MANEVAQTQRSIDTLVQSQINDLVAEENGLKLPKNYAVGNAIKSAFFTLKSSNDGDLIQMATRIPEMQTSIANALMDMVVQGLTPAKTQVYFIKYGQKVQMQRSYFGTQAALKRLTEVDDCWANVVHEGDKFDISAEDDRLVVTGWHPTLEGLDKEIKFVYAVIKMEDGSKQYTVMTLKQIKNSWSQTRSKGAVQNKFSDEMAKRTVLNRAAKNILNTSDDSDLVVGAINNTTSNEYDDDKPAKDVTPKKVDDLIGNASTEEPTTSEDEPKDVTPAESEAEPVESLTNPDSEIDDFLKDQAESDSEGGGTDDEDTKQVDLFSEGTTGVQSKFD